MKYGVYEVTIFRDEQALPKTERVLLKKSPLEYAQAYAEKEGIEIIKRDISQRTVQDFVFKKGENNLMMRFYFKESVEVWD